VNVTLAKKLRFSDVVYAINTSPKSLRLWLQRGLVTIHTPKPKGAGWKTYSFIDISILALAKQLVSWGVPVPTASKIANAIMKQFFPEMLRLQNPENMPAGALALSWTNRRLLLFQEGGEWHLKLVSLWESELGASRGDGFDAPLPSGVAALRREIEPAPVYLAIDVETVLRTAFDRANDSVTEANDEDDTE
jgi:hypothetical protein